VGRPVSQYFPIQVNVVLTMIAGKGKGGEVDFWEALWSNISRYIHIPFLKLIPQLDLTVIVVLQRLSNLEMVAGGPRLGVDTAMVRNIMGTNMATGTIHKTSY
jgi:hypothetical protein